MKLLQGDPMGRKTTLKKPLVANAMLGLDEHRDVGGIGQVGEVAPDFEELANRAHADSVLVGI